MAPLMTVGVGLFLAPVADADVRAGRTVEIFHGRNIVAVEGYPVGTPVKVEVLRGEEVIGFATYTPQNVDGHQGFFEINHLGDGDCWQSPYTPNILPGDVVRTSVEGEAAQDTSATRDVFINQEAEFLPGNVIRVTGHARNTAAAPFGPGDIVELRMNKVNRDNGWETNGGRRDLRLADVLPQVGADGTYTHDFVVSEDDWNDAQTAGIDISTVWIRGGEAATELTFYDGEPEATQGCPPPLPDDRIAPSQVTGVIVSQPALGTVELDWSAATDNVGVTGYVVTRTNLDTNAVDTYQAGAGLFWSQTRVPTGRYSYTVHALDATPNAGAKSAAVLVGVGVDAPLDAPTELAATVTGNSVALSWTAPAGTVASYQVLRGTTVVAETVTGTTFTNTNVPVGTHSYTVRARSADGTLSPASASASAEVVADTTAPGAPTGLAASVTGSSVALSWTAPTGEAAASYQVLRGTTVVANSVTGTTFTNTSVPAGTHNYTVKARDAAGNLSVASNTATATVQASDTTAPTVTGRSPGINGVSIGVAANATATFSEPVQGVSGTTVYLRRTGTTTNIGAGVSYDATNRRATLNPTNNLATDTNYTVTLTSGIRDAAGNPLTQVSWSFTTGPAPRVTAQSPAANATGISRTANVTATFSEVVQGVSGTTFQLRNPAGTQISATVSRNGTTNQWILNPGVTLAARTTYTVRLVGGGNAIRDMANNPLAGRTWTFTTGA